MSAPAGSWLTVERRDAPLVVSFPHTGTVIPEGFRDGLVSLTLARKDTDWWIDRLYGFVRGMGATIVHTNISRTVIDVNRDPGGTSLYPGQATTELCPTTTFDGEPLYEPGAAPDAKARAGFFFDPYHGALSSELLRLRELHPRVVLYDCHSIRSVISRLFDGMLPHFNIGTNSGASCDHSLTAAVEAACDASGLSRVTDARFKGGYITRTHGDPAIGVHAIQMELACRGYMRERPGPVSPTSWPTPWDEAYARPMTDTLKHVMEACLRFAGQR